MDVAGQFTAFLQEPGAEVASTRGSGIITAAEIGKPVRTANQVTVWEKLRLLGVDTARAGLGTLFAAASG